MSLSFGNLGHVVEQEREGVQERFWRDEREGITVVNYIIISKQHKQKNEEKSGRELDQVKEMKRKSGKGRHRGRIQEVKVPSSEIQILIFNIKKVSCLFGFFFYLLRVSAYRGQQSR